MGGRVQQKAGDMVGDTKTQAEGIYNQASGRAQQVWGQAQDASEQLSDTIRAQPLIAAGVALGLGYLIGRLTS